LSPGGRFRWLKHLPDEYAGSDRFYELTTTFL
jgi:hypothetical protein